MILVDFSRLWRFTRKPTSPTSFMQFFNLCFVELPKPCLKSSRAIFEKKQSKKGNLNLLRHYLEQNVFICKISPLISNPLKPIFFTKYQNPKNSYQPKKISSPHFLQSNFKKFIINLKLLVTVCY